MNKHLLSAIIMALCLIPSIAHAYDFEAVNDDGVTLYYNILSENDKTCELTRCEGGDWEELHYRGDIVIPSQANGYKVIAIGSHTFAEIPDYHTVTIPNTVTSIKSCAFYNNTALEEITIPSSVVSIGDYCFWCCPALKKITSYITNLFDTGKYAFLDCSQAVLYVPKGYVSTYKLFSGWDGFSVYKEIPSIEFSCNTKGSVSINGAPSITGKILAAEINEGSENTFTFSPKTDCKLEQVVLNGLDITSNVENNTLIATIPENSQMIVSFAAESGDLNNDGHIDITDVVAIVNKILGI